MSIGIAIVTYNRIEKLKKTLELFDNQSYLPEYIIVVNNCSTDGTEDYLNAWKENSKIKTKIVYNLDRNTGGSGGYYIALQEAMKQDAEWVWVSDDDAFPEKNTLYEANEYLEKHAIEKDSISAICAKVINYDQIDLSHRKTLKPAFYKIKTIYMPREAYDLDAYEINAFSYVGVIINVEKLKTCGLPNKDYFIWYDDTEHSLRLSHHGRILCVPSIVVHHDTGSTQNEFSWKKYYGCRNLIDMYRKHFGCWYVFLFCSKEYIKTLFMKKEKRKLFWTAIHDARVGKLGLHEIYKPGWNSK